MIHLYHMQVAKSSNVKKKKRSNSFKIVIARYLPANTIINRKKQDIQADILLFGARDGTRTHTAITTRTSNVLVYHSNTLANSFCIITP